MRSGRRTSDTEIEGHVVMAIATFSPGTSAFARAASPQRKLGGWRTRIRTGQAESETYSCLGFPWTSPDYVASMEQMPPSGSLKMSSGRGSWLNSRLGRHQSLWRLSLTGSRFSPARPRHKGPSSMGFEDEVEQSLRRPCPADADRLVGPSGHTISLHPSSREDIIPPAGGSSSFLLSLMTSCGVLATVSSGYDLPGPAELVPSTHIQAA